MNLDDEHRDWGRIKWNESLSGIPSSASGSHGDPAGYGNEVKIFSGRGRELSGGTGIVHGPVKIEKPETQKGQGTGLHEIRSQSLGCHGPDYRSRKNAQDGIDAG